MHAGLVGSERSSYLYSHDQGVESASINKSLLTLGTVIAKLADRERGRSQDHMPYRDSKLTRILQEALGGNSKTSLFVACSPHLDNMEETISTLRFAQRAKTIKNKVKLNEEKSVGEMKATLGPMPWRNKNNFGNNAMAK